MQAKNATSRYLYKQEDLFIYFQQQAQGP